MSDRQNELIERTVDEIASYFDLDHKRGDIKVLRASNGACDWCGVLRPCEERSFCVVGTSTTTTVGAPTVTA